MEQLKITAAVTKVELEGIKVSLNEVKRDLKDLAKDLGHKIDRVIYFFIGGLMLKGGFDLYMKGDKTETKDIMWESEAVSASNVWMLISHVAYV